MKTLNKFIGTLAVAAILCTSCGDGIGNSDPCYNYGLLLIFKDVAGNYLSEGLEYNGYVSDVIPDAGYGPVKPDLYSLEVVFPETCMYMVPPDGGSYTYPNRFPELVISTPKSKHDAIDSNFYLMINIVTPKHKCSFAKTFTIKMKCPHIFGDEKIHEIETWWTGKNFESASPDVRCTRIKLDGKEVDISYVENMIYPSLVTVIL